VTALLNLAPWHERFRGQLAGSVYAAPYGSRITVAESLSAAGMKVHVDVMAETEGLPAGVSMAELAGIVSAVGPSMVEVHLIGSTEFVDTRLLRVLQLRPARVFLPWGAFTERRVDALRAVGSSAWIALWREWDGIDPSAPPWRTAPDGVLVMLIEPGSLDRCTIDRLDIVTACASTLPVAVDGGVTESVAERSVAAGVRSVVVGRALLGDLTEASELHAISNEGTTWPSKK
jgi:pentose-5-phosphate-3-epimerase